VETMKELRIFWIHILQEWGYEVWPADSGLQAMGMIEKDTYHLVVLDLWMPEMEGMDLLRQIRKLRSRLPVMLFSTRPGMKGLVEALRHEACDYITGCEPMEGIFYRIENLISRFKLELTLHEIINRISDVSHCISQPLSAIQIQCDILLSENGESLPYKSDIEHIGSCVKRISDIVSNMRSMTKSLSIRSPAGHG